MVDQTPNTTSDTAQQEPFIPPQYLLYLSGLGFLVALIVLLTQPSFGVVGFGGLAFGILALIGWVLMAPQEVGNILSGRTLRFGGTSLLITILLLVAMAVVYVLARGANLRYDLTESDTFSLSEESRQAMQALAADPTIPNIRLLAFYGSGQAGDRDRDSLLLQEYADASGGKVSYEFIDPDQRFDLAQDFAITREGSIAVATFQEDGTTLDSENAEIVNFLSQQDLTNAILQVAAQGNFVAYFLTVEDGASGDMSTLKQVFTTRYDWTVQDVTLLQLTSPESEFRLNDETRDGEVVVVPGGSRPLSVEELQVLQDYVNGGGDLIILAQPVLNDRAESLATDPALNEYLFANFGVQFNRDVVIDQTQAFQSPLIPFATTFDRQNYITSNGITANSAVVLEAPNSLSIADTLPQNVSVSRLITTSTESYSKTDIEALLAATDSAALAEAEGDAQGPFVVAAAAENAQTGSRVILFGSLAPALDQYINLSGASNLDIAFNSLVWATNFNDFFATVNVTQPTRPQDSPIFASQQTLREISFWTQWALPFGILALGALILYINRERRRAA